MTLSRIILIAVLGVVLVVTGGSLFLLKNVQDKASEEVKLDKGTLILDRAQEYIRYGNQKKAVGALLTVIDSYPDSVYAEKAIRQMASLYEERKELPKAKYYYEKLVIDFPDIKDADDIRKHIDSINMKLMASTDIADGATIHKVVPGDSLYAIARRYGTTVGLIKMVNDLKSDTIKVGQRLKIVTAEFSIYVDKAKNIMVLKKDGIPFKQYTIATGTNNSTPVGTFKITDKVIDAPWTKPNGEVVLPGDPEYELGARWMAIDEPGYGIHGTNDESSIGGQTTAGCVRMYNKDVIELYSIVPNGTEVVIVDSADTSKPIEEAAEPVVEEEKVAEEQQVVEG